MEVRPGQYLHYRGTYLEVFPQVCAERGIIYYQDPIYRDRISSMPTSQFQEQLTHIVFENAPAYNLVKDGNQTMIKRTEQVILIVAPALHDRLIHLYHLQLACLSYAQGLSRPEVASRFACDGNIWQPKTVSHYLREVKQALGEEKTECLYDIMREAYGG